MITTHIHHAALGDVNAQGYVIFCDENNVTKHPHFDELVRFYKPLAQLCEQRHFTGKSGSVVVAGQRDGSPVYCMLFGLGTLNKLPADMRIERYRRAVGSAMRAAEHAKITKLALALPAGDMLGVSDFIIAQETSSIADIATYHFDQFITDAARKLSRDYDITLCAPESVHQEIKAGSERGLRIGHAVNQARQWCDFPANILRPAVLAEKAEHIAKTHDLKITVFSEEEIKKMGMGGLASVSQGSAEDCKLAIIEYHTSHPGAPTIAIVGKGITFDSGGLSIKPAKSMETMKDDMSGAAVVISTMEVIAHIKPRVNVIALAPMAENMPSGTASRPGDIVSFYNGMTAEIKNTDAEGRLILADALSYAVKHYKLDAIIDLATLTGACAYALGPFFAGLLSQNEKLSKQIAEAGSRSGDRVWPLPMSEDYRPAVRAEVADLCNSGSEKYRAGAITGAFFLSNFVGNVPWVHIDSAGTAFDVPDISYYRPGGTGFGVRLFVDLITNWPV